MDGGSETTSTHSKDGTNDDGVDNNGIYNGENDDDDGNFTYHSSAGPDEEDEDGDEVLDNGAAGTSLKLSTCGKDGQSFIGGQLADLPDWLHEIETNNTHNTSLLFAAPITQFFSVHCMQDYRQPHNMDSHFFCKRQAIPHGGCLTKTSAK
jgi:hypothetical protein